MMVVGDNLGEKEEKIEEAAQLGKPATAPLCHITMIILIWINIDFYFFPNALITMLKKLL